MNKLIGSLFTLCGTSAALLVLRLFAGGILLPHGIQKIENFEALSKTFADPVGLGPQFSLVLITATETLGSLLIILGLFTRPAALAVSVGMFVAAFLSSPEGFSFDKSQLPLLLMGVYLTLMITGAGRYSLDEPIRRRIMKEV